MIAKLGFWRTRKYHLDKMTFRELVAAFFQYYAIQVYLLITVVGYAYAWTNFPGWLETGATLLATALVYPLIWYTLHRYVLHGTWLAKTPFTASLWKRIHFDHHQDPHDLYILFGALYTTLPTVAAATMPIGYAFGGWAGAMIGLASGALVTCYYEFCHCVEHLSYKPKNKWLLRMKTAHMAHHFHNEQGNFGITNFLWDRVFGTYYTNEQRPEKSPTVFNIGYDASMAEKYPWVATLSGGVSDMSPRERRQNNA